MNLKLESKLALVTGSTAGIGFAIAKALAGEGARVIVNGRGQERVDQAISRIRAELPKARLEPLALDLSHAEAAAETISQFPEVDILVNNLGVYVPKPFEDISDPDWLAIIETNFLSGVTPTFAACKAGWKPTGRSDCLFAAGLVSANIR